MSSITESSLDSALADIELLCAAYPEEVVFKGEPVQDVNGDHQQDNYAASPTASRHCFPLTVTIHLDDHSLMDFQFNEGYPENSTITVSRYRSTKDYSCLLEAVRAAEKMALDCMEEGVEGALPCCAAAFEAWNGAKEDQTLSSSDAPVSLGDGAADVANELSQPSVVWISGEPLLDRKSTFQAHLCLVNSEDDVQNALQALHTINNKIARATHNMVRIVCFPSSFSCFHPVGIQVYNKNKGRCQRNCPPR